RRRHTRSKRDWSSDVCSSDLELPKWEAKLIASLPNTDLLSADSFGALVSLIYNRGASFNLLGARYQEMRTIKACMANQMFDEIRSEERRVGKEGRSRRSQYA